MERLIEIIKDEGTEQHCIRVSRIVRILASKLHEENHNIDEELLSKAALYHDLGKSYIPDSILNKAGRLTEEEFSVMKSHSTKGADLILSEMPEHNQLADTAYEIARWHHERYDGHGYPDQLQGDEIPISAQITSVADVYDALTSERSYKKAFSSEKAVEMISHGECGLFNPVLIQCLIACQQQLCMA